MTHHYDPQDRPVYPVGSYWGQAIDWLDDHPDHVEAYRAIFAMFLGMVVMALSLEWVY